MPPQSALQLVQEAGKLLSSLVTEMQKDPGDEETIRVLEVLQSAAFSIQDISDLLELELPDPNPK
jgi:hypothetical protein